MLKRVMLLWLFVSLIFVSCEKSDDSPSSKSISIEMGAGYVNDIFYKTGSGVVSSVPRNTWDIAFHTYIMSSSIITNGGSGVELYTYPKGNISAWNTMDTAGIKSWKVLYNSDTTWTLSAFERNTASFPDYGWGIYNMADHNITGDSLYVIKTITGLYKQLWIKKKISSQNKWVIAFSDLNGENSKTDTIDCNLYSNKHFIYYSLETGTIIDREPEKSKWDLLVTKYVTMAPYGNSFMPYIVTGVLTNTMRLNNKGIISYTGIRTAQKEGVDISSNDYSSADFNTSISTIGYDWKTMNHGTSIYTLKSNLAYFIKTEDNSIYKIVFTKFAGSSTGAIEFTETHIK